ETADFATRSSDPTGWRGKASHLESSHMRASLITASLLVALVGCSSTVAEQNSSGTTGNPPPGSGGTGGGETTASGGSGGSGGTGGAPEVAYPAPHPGMPQIPNHGGAVLHDPVIVTVTFAGDPFE